MSYRVILATAIVLGAGACTRGTQAANQQAQALQSSAPQVPDSSRALSAATDSEIVRGACPFECCQYGKWTLETPADVRAAPSQGASMVGHFPAGTAVNADSGLVLVKPTGLFYAVTDVKDSLRKFTLRRGDTLMVLDPLGEGVVRARLHDSALTVSMWDLDPNFPDRVGELKMLRAPDEQWWVHFTVAGSLRGWVLMTDVRMLGADACGS